MIMILANLTISCHNVIKNTRIDFNELEKTIIKKGFLFYSILSKQLNNLFERDPSIKTKTKNIKGNVANTKENGEKRGYLDSCLDRNEL